MTLVNRDPRPVTREDHETRTTDHRLRIVQERWSGTTWFGILDRPIRCGLCGEEVLILANDGWTRCLFCWAMDAIRNAERSTDGFGRLTTSEHG